MIEEITVDELKTQLDSGAQITLVDVRRDNELDICRLKNAVHIPLHLLPVRFTELDRETPLVIFCHHGARSQQAVCFLVEKGYKDVRNLMGGIEAWATLIDTTMARY